jgi:hypothetical protein
LAGFGIDVQIAKNSRRSRTPPKTHLFNQSSSVGRTIMGRKERRAAEEGSDQAQGGNSKRKEYEAKPDELHMEKMASRFMEEPAKQKGAKRGRPWKVAGKRNGWVQVDRTS